ncbi:hypothetical protein L7F22_025806 [Adiantum nelumboides]|nr:hypothetical protein [Adiantum nelumboides]
MSLFRNHLVHPWDFLPLHLGSVLHDTDTASDSSKDFFSALRKPDFLHGPRVDIVEGADGFHLTAELPGVKKEDVNINVVDKERRLTISGTMRSEYHSGGSTEAAPATTANDQSTGSSSSSSSSSKKAEDSNAKASTDVATSMSTSTTQTAVAQHRPIISERTFGSFSRTFVLPESADLDNIKARFQDGLLKLNVAKKAAEKQRPRAVAIEDASD